MEKYILFHINNICYLNINFKYLCFRQSHFLIYSCGHSQIRFSYYLFESFIFLSRYQSRFSCLSALGLLTVHSCGIYVFNQLSSTEEPRWSLKLLFKVSLSTSKFTNHWSCRLLSIRSSMRIVFLFSKHSFSLRIW